MQIGEHGYWGRLTSYDGGRSLPRRQLDLERVALPGEPAAEALIALFNSGARAPCIYLRAEDEAWVFEGIVTAYQATWPVVWCGIDGERKIEPARATAIVLVLGDVAIARRTPGLAAPLIVPPEAG